MRTGADGFHSDIRPHLANEENDLTSLMRLLLNALLDDLAHIEARVAAINKEIEAIAYSDDTMRQLLTIPDIGPLGATALVTAAGDGKLCAKRDLIPHQLIWNPRCGSHQGLADKISRLIRGWIHLCKPTRYLISSLQKQGGPYFF